MRMRVVGVLLFIGSSIPSAGAQPLPGLSDDLASLERAWHRCVREAYARQPKTQSRAASQRSALDECQVGEDVYVAAAMKVAGKPDDPGARRGLTERARAWASSVAAEVIDPVSSWFSASQR